MQSFQIHRRVAAALLGAGLVATAQAAEPASPSAQTTDPCSGVETLASEKAELSVIYDEARKLCAARTVDAIKASVTKAKAATLVDALTNIGKIHTSSGAISNPENADHIGEWYAQQLLQNAALEVSGKVTTVFKSAAGTTPIYLFTTDPTITSSRLAIQGILGQLNSMRKNLLNLNEQADEAERAVTKPPAKGSQPKGAIPLVLEALPAAVSAVQALASLAKNEFALSSLTLDTSKQRELILAGLCSAGCPNLRIAGGAANPSFALDDNPFAKTYAQLQAKVGEAQIAYTKLQSHVDKLGEDAAPAGVKDVRTALKNQLAEFDALNKAFHTFDATKNGTLFDALVKKSGEIFSSDSQIGTLIVTPTHYAGHGGKVVSKWQNDRVFYEITTSLTYTVLDTNGTIAAAGSVYKSHSFVGDIIPVERSLPAIGIR